MHRDHAVYAAGSVDASNLGDGMKKWAPVCILLAIAILSGCVERALVITSDPPGADVTVNQQWKGKTPYVIPFKHYGVYDIWIEHPGVMENGRMVKYYPLHVGEPVKAPKYQYAGADFVTEVLLPKTLYDQHTLHYTLERVADADDLDDVLDRSAQLREASRARTRMRYEKDEALGRTPGERSFGNLLRRRDDGSYEEAPSIGGGGREDLPMVEWDGAPPLPSEVPVFVDPVR